MIIKLLLLINSTHLIKIKRIINYSHQFWRDKYGKIVYWLKRSKYIIKFLFKFDLKIYFFTSSDWSVFKWKSEFYWPFENSVTVFIFDYGYTDVTINNAIYSCCYIHTHTHPDINSIVMSYLHIDRLLWLFNNMYSWFRAHFHIGLVGKSNRIMQINNNFLFFLFPFRLDFLPFRILRIKTFSEWKGTHRIQMIGIEDLVKPSNIAANVCNKWNSFYIFTIENWLEWL